MANQELGFSWDVGVRWGVGSGVRGVSVSVRNSKAMKETSAYLEQEFIISFSLFMETPSSTGASSWVYSIPFKVPGIVQVISICLWNE